MRGSPAGRSRARAVLGRNVQDERHRVVPGWSLTGKRVLKPTLAWNDQRNGRLDVSTVFGSSSRTPWPY